MDRVEDLLRLVHCNGLGPRLFLRLKEHFSSADAILGAAIGDLREVEGVGELLARRIAQAGQYDPRPELERAEQHNARLIGADNPEYPAALKETFDPPILLYVRGQLLPEDAIALAMVGTRQPSQYGRAQAERFASLFARQGFTIVSGLARGIDSICHRGAITAGGRTLAVLGSGLGRIYPEENTDLAEAIINQGALISEMPMDAAPTRESFPRRNRIIAGLGLGTLVVEAPKRSGSLITARLATELGREVFALPGRIDQRNAEGVNHLIAAGHAKLVQGMECVLEELGPVADALRPDIPAPAADEGAPEPEHASNDEPPPRDAGSAVADREARLLGVMGSEEMHIDEICRRSHLPVQEVSAALMMLELKRAVRQLPGRLFVRLTH